MTTSVQTFSTDTAAKDAIRDLVDALIDVAEDAGQAPSDWNSISCDGSLNSTLRELGGAYAEAADGDDAELRDAIVEYADEVTVEMTSSKVEQLGNAVRNAKNLDELVASLEAADEYAERAKIDAESIYRATQESLPTFGGVEPANTDGIYSWDETRILYGFGEWTVDKRTAETGATLHQEAGGFEVDGISYRFESRHYRGADQIDTVRFSRWKPENDFSNVFAGYIDIDAFPRDIVLLSEMIKAIENREAELEEVEAEAAE